LAVKRVDWSTPEQRASIAKVWAVAVFAASVYIGVATQQLVLSNTGGTTHLASAKWCTMTRQAVTVPAVSVMKGISYGMLRFWQVLCWISSTVRVQQSLVGRMTRQLTCCLSCVLLQRVATEITVLQSLQHPLLPKLHQVYTTGNEICLEMTVSLHLKPFLLNSSPLARPSADRALRPLGSS
jgi:hypothetical protein